MTTFRETGEIERPLVHLLHERRVRIDNSPVTKNAINFRDNERGIEHML